jgi:mRNA interferase MazF
VVSVDRFNHGPAGLAIVVPITSKDKGIALHVVIEPPTGGLTVRSFAKPEDVRSVSTERLVRRAGAVSPAILDEVRDRLRVVLGL